MAQEELIKASAVQYTIVRATQVFEFVNSIAHWGTAGEAIRLPPALMQPVVSEDVAAILADIVLGAPVNGMIELAGPERIPLSFDGSCAHATTHAR